MKSPSHKINDIIWEKFLHHSNAKLYVETKSIQHPGMHVKNIAFSKLIDVTLLTADFEGSTVTFEPCITILVDNIKTAEYFGVFLTSFSPQEGKPTILLRYSTWDQNLDYEQFEKARSKRCYILDDRQVILKNTFTTQKEQGNIVTLIDEIIHIGMRGLPLEPCQREDNRCNRMYCQIISHTSPFTKEFYYHPPQLKCEIFEDWLVRWIKAFQEVDFYTGYVPDNSPSISYKMSCIERINLIQE